MHIHDYLGKYSLNMNPAGRGMRTYGGSIRGLAIPILCETQRVRENVYSRSYAASSFLHRLTGLGGNASRYLDYVTTKYQGEEYEEIYKKEALLLCK